MARTYWVEAYPYATQVGEVEVPDDVSDDDAEVWIGDHWDKIKFEEKLRLDYRGADWTCEKETD